MQANPRHALGITFAYIEFGSVNGRHKASYQEGAASTVHDRAASLVASITSDGLSRVGAFDPSRPVVQMRVDTLLMLGVQFRQGTFQSPDI